jgi:hypothetical protein
MNADRFIQTTLSISVGLLVLIFMEGMMTLGTAFNFDKYNWFCWFVQALLVIMTISLSLKISSKMDEEN